ncbi:protein U5 [Suid betaherpesvirus 2]|uniref:Protein U5 n=1 Tax=Suid betaherpesvirus 2 TaxID=1608255 RepID=U3GPI7_9BETA|nr:protein U5 [Suid betaherpesvirus 2]AGT99206.1 protein U5 [Suid betaherpesvirus 2]
MRHVEAAVKKDRDGNYVFDMTPGQTYRLTWPPGYALTVGEPTVFNCEMDFGFLRHFDILGLHEKLVPVGFAHPCMRNPDVFLDPYVFISNLQRMFALDVDESILYLLSETIHGFISSGLRNLGMLYDANLTSNEERSWFGSTTSEHRKLCMLHRNHAGMKEYVRKHSGEVIYFKVFSACNFILCCKDDIEYSGNRGSIEELEREDFYVVGTISGDVRDPSCRHVILLDSSMSVYCFDGHRASKISRSLRSFIRQGPSEFEKRCRGERLGEEDIYVPLHAIEEAVWTDNRVNAPNISPIRSLMAKTRYDDLDIWGCRVFTSTLYVFQPCFHLFLRRTELTSVYYYEVGQIDDDDLFSQKFVSRYLKKRNACSSLLNVKGIIRISGERIWNSVEATLHGRYLIKGFTLFWDSLMWVVLLDLQNEMHKYPFTYMRLSTFIRHLSEAKFFDDYPAACQPISKILAISLHASSSLYAYRDQFSIAYWVRYSAEYAMFLLHVFKKMVHQVPEPDQKMLAGIIPNIFMDDDYCEMEDRDSVFFREDVYMLMETFLIETCALLCGCEDCKGSVVSMCIKHQQGGERYTSNGPHLFFRACPEMGRFPPPVLPHVESHYKRVIFNCLQEDFCLSLLEGNIGRHCLPLSVKGLETSGAKNILSVLINLVFVAYICKTLYKVLRIESGLCKDYFKKCMGELFEYQKGKVGQDCGDEKITYELLMKCEDCLQQVSDEGEAVTCLTENGFSGIDTFLYRLFEYCQGNNYSDKEFVNILSIVPQILLYIKEYKEYSTDNVMRSFLLHYLYINRQFIPIYGEQLLAEKVVPGFILMNHGDADFYSIVRDKKRGITDDILSNSVDVDGLLCLTFSFVRRYFLYAGGRQEVDVPTPKRKTFFTLSSSKLPDPKCMYYIPK